MIFKLFTHTSCHSKQSDINVNVTYKETYKKTKYELLTH